MKINLSVKHEEKYNPRIIAEIDAPEYEGQEYELLFSYWLREEPIFPLGLFRGKIKKGETVSFRCVTPTHYFITCEPCEKYYIKLTVGENTEETFLEYSKVFPHLKNYGF